ncbi:serine/threonine-protein kinase [Rhodococcus sp. IEGM 1409]|uniref:serine/threonine-protein kinase n=1 Tax=Rhodococcus sp. IEGM 1409 TaxID=3047082 RepID=UPI0024B73091|nr:serine/threonine-protein kinase [Rhodococcus sp. IEGM 1409]MDI9903831.1 serine/threonine-protein kinase [Rhodococcus sp. IEGM 1409]
MLQCGSVFAGYRIERLLGRGGMSEAYLAIREGQRSTLKLLNEECSADPRLRARFVAEAELASGLDHPNIVSVKAFGDEGGQLWMAMQYVEGYSAARLVARGQIPLDPFRAARIVDSVARGLDYAHSRGIVHRDVKPANILISTQATVDGHEQVMLSDWGIARLVDDSAPVARSGSVLASIQYAPPELLRAEPLTTRVDVYGLGCTVVELLTGATPFPLSNPLAIADAQLHTPPPSVSERRRELPAALDAVVATALAKDPADRYSRCVALADAVMSALAEWPTRTSPFAARVSDTSGPRFRWLKRR